MERNLPARKKWERRYPHLPDKHPGVVSQAILCTLWADEWPMSIGTLEHSGARWHEGWAEAYHF